VTVKLNLGCGDTLLPDFINFGLFGYTVEAWKLDELTAGSHIYKLDLNNLPLPLPNSFAAHIRLSQVLEHLTCHPFEFIQECYRILQPDGVLFVGLPSFSHSLPHLRGYHPEGFMNTVIGKGYPSTKDYHCRAVFKLEKFERDFSLKLLLRRIWELVRALASKKIEWTMVKTGRKDD